MQFPLLCNPVSYNYCYGSPGWIIALFRMRLSPGDTKFETRCCKLIIKFDTQDRKTSILIDNMDAPSTWFFNSKDVTWIANLFLYEFSWHMTWQWKRNRTFWEKGRELQLRDVKRLAGRRRSIWRESKKLIRIEKIPSYIIYLWLSTTFSTAVKEVQVDQRS